MAGTTTSGAARATSVDDPGFAARIRERDAQALEEVVRRYLPQILRAARSAGFAPQLAEDVAQDTFVTFIETAPRFEGRSHVRTWLFGILYKKMAAARRNLRRDNEMDDIEEVFEQRFDDAGSWTRRSTMPRCGGELTAVWTGFQPTSGWPSSCVRSKGWIPKKSVRFWRSRAPT